MYRVLIVDDEPGVLRLYRMFFEHSGFEVLEADNISDAARLHREHLPDALILDVSMQDGGALALLPTLRAEGSKAHAFVVTGGPIESIRADARRYGAAVLYKPDGAAKLVEAVVAALPER